MAMFESIFDQILNQPLSGHTDIVLRNVLNQSRFAFLIQVRDRIKDLGAIIQRQSKLPAL